jgi:hypothetical protein
MEFWLASTSINVALKLLIREKGEFQFPTTFFLLSARVNADLFLPLRLCIFLYACIKYPFPLAFAFAFVGKPSLARDH